MMQALALMLHINPRCFSVQIVFPYVKSITTNILIIKVN